MVMLLDALYEARVQLCLSADATPSATFAALLQAASGGEMLSGAEVDVGQRSTPAERVPGGQLSGGSDAAPSFEEAPVGGRFRVDGELASFFTAKDESFMLRRTLSRLAEMCEVEERP